MNWLLNLFSRQKTSVQFFEGMGRGIRAERDFKVGDIVEETPVVVIDRQENNDLNSCVLNLYRFGWQDSQTCIAMGTGSLFNHSFECNLNYRPDLDRKVMIFIAKENIKKGDQLFIDYGYEPICAHKRYLKKKSERTELEKLEKMRIRKKFDDAIKKSA